MPLRFGRRATASPPRSQPLTALFACPGTPLRRPLQEWALRMVHLRRDRRTRRGLFPAIGLFVLSKELQRGVDKRCGSFAQIRVDRPVVIAREGMSVFSLLRSRWSCGRESAGQLRHRCLPLEGAAHLDVFTETRRVIVSRGFGISESLHDGITGQNLPFHLAHPIVSVPIGFSPP